MGFVRLRRRMDEAVQRVGLMRRLKLTVRCNRQALARLGGLKHQHNLKPPATGFSRCRRQCRSRQVRSIRAPRS